MGHAYIVSGFGLGDEGKGSIVDFLARSDGNIHMVIRANGGAQARHNVVTPDGVHHTFAQFGSATFVPSVRTHLSRFMLVSPPHLLREAKILAAIGVENPMRRLTISGDAPLITPYHRAANWIRELTRGSSAHGTCGMGIGETMQDFISGKNDTVFARDLLNSQLLSRKLHHISRRKQLDLQELIKALPQPLSLRAEQAVLALTDESTLVSYLLDCKDVRTHARVVEEGDQQEILSHDASVIFEGAQGVLLDEWYGFHPHTTWSTTTFENPLTLLNECGFTGPVTRIGVLRAYATRHGAGPLVTEDRELTKSLVESHNRSDGWPGQFRVGWFDLVTARYALLVAGGADALAITCLDRLTALPTVKVCTGYLYCGQTSRNELERLFELEDAGGQIRILGIRVSDSRDLDRQSRITACLSQSVPEYTNVTSSGLLNYLERELRVPIRIASFGMKASEKIFRSQGRTRPEAGVGVVQT